ncbi:Predicted dehydrogenase [Haladaptatus litoreus]|uniref:Predicted dehydrogenase n=1 Tax=Haladaptatus litoreus TaxID=553468 RepID=A0A1N6YY62_9EURY|nr:Gfo/Idh/MocA family oxidoreductase [Haladaptatus litoreus]SIR19537.1 Predicted dehydrogenase [Haladaptatus litoreus]
MSESVNAVVIGVGSMGRHHARVYSELPEVNLVGIHDVDENRASEAARDHGSQAVSMEEAIREADIASIAVPTPYHYETAKRCIEGGVHILVEKPFVAEPEEGRGLIARAEDAGVTIQVGHIERFNPAIRTLSEIVSELDIIAIDAQRLGPPPEGRAVDVSAVMDLMIHDLDVLLSIVDDDITSVTAVGTQDNRYASANIEFDGGVVAGLTASRVTQEKVRKLSITAEECRVNVDYTNQSVEIHRHSMPEYIEDNGDLRYRHESIVERPTVENGEPLKNELRSFVRSVTTGSTPVVTGEDGLRVLEVAQEIDELASGLPEQEVHLG